MAKFGSLDVTAQHQAVKNIKEQMAASTIGGSALAREIQDAFSTIDYQDADGEIDSHDSYVAVAYQLSRTNEIAIAALDKYTNSIIGTGLKLQPDVNREVLERLQPGISEGQIDDLEGEIEDDYVMWSEDPYQCDVERKLTVADHQRLSIRTEKAAGDSFTLIGRRDPRTATTGGWLTQLQSVSPVRIRNKDDDYASRQHTGGVVRNASGAVTGYEVRTHHPDSNKLDTFDYTWQTVPRYARSGRQNMIHIMQDLESDQSRGRPVLAPIAKTIARISKFTDAQVMAALVQAFFAVYFENEGGPPGLSYGEEATKAGNTPVNADGSIDLKDGTGIVGGSTPHMITTSQPGPHLEQFFDAMLKNVGMALGIPAEVLTSTFHESYSASRAALLEFWKVIALGRHTYTLKWCKPVYHAYLSDRVAQGVFAMPGFSDDIRIQKAWCGSVWLGDARGAIDKRAEVGPEIEMIRAGIRAPSSFSEEYNGVPHRTTVRREARDKRMRDRNGLEPPQQEPQLFEVKDRLAEQALERAQQAAEAAVAANPDEPQQNNEGNDDE